MFSSWANVYILEKKTCRGGMPPCQPCSRNITDFNISQIHECTFPTSQIAKSDQPLPTCHFWSTIGCQSAQKNTIYGHRSLWLAPDGSCYVGCFSLLTKSHWPRQLEPNDVSVWCMLQYHVPRWLQNTQIYSWPRDHDDILRRLMRVEKYNPPPIGPLPTIVSVPI